MMLSASFHRKGCNNQGCAYDQTELNRRAFDFTPDVSMFQLIHCPNRMHYRIQRNESYEKNLDRLAFQLCKLLPRSGNEFSCSLLIIRELQMCTARTKTHIGSELPITTLKRMISAAHQKQALMKWCKYLHRTQTYLHDEHGTTEKHQNTVSLSSARILLS